MTLDLRARPQLILLLAVAATLAAEMRLVASPAFAVHPGALSAAVACDLLIVLPAIFWALFIRTGRVAPRLLWCAVAIGLLAAGAILPVEQFKPLRRVLGNGIPARALATELALLHFALFSFCKKPRAGSYSVHKRAGSSAIAWALGLGVVAEAIPFHVLLRQHHAGWAWVLTALHGYTLLWLLGDAQAMRLSGITIEGAVLAVRIGLRWQVRIPLAQIAAVEMPQGESLDRKQVFHASVLGSANFVLRLRAPVVLRGFFGIERRASAVALSVDEPAKLAAHLRR